METIKDLRLAFRDINEWSRKIVLELQEHFEGKFEEFDEAPLLDYYNNEYDDMGDAYFIEVEVQTEEYNTMITLHFYYGTNQVDVTSRDATVEHIGWAWEFMKTKGEVRTF